VSILACSEVGTWVEVSVVGTELVVGESAEIVGSAETGGEVGDEIGGVFSVFGGALTPIC